MGSLEDTFRHNLSPTRKGVKSYLTRRDVSHNPSPHPRRTTISTTARPRSSASCIEGTTTISTPSAAR